MPREIRYAIRSLLRTPIFTAASITILTLAIGANTAVFSMLHALILRPLPVPAPHELVQLSTRDKFGRVGDLTFRQFRELLASQRVFSAVMGSLSQGVLTVEAEGTVLRASMSAVTGNYFRELGVVPALGRLLSESDEDLASATAEHVAVLSWSFWQRQYGGSPDVIGKRLRVEGTPLTIVGVAPQGFLGLGITIEPDVTFPLPLAAPLLDNDMAMIRGTLRWVATTGRLAPGVGLAEARAQIFALWPSIVEASYPVGVPDDYLSPERRERYFDSVLQVDSGATGIERGLRGRYATPLWTLLGIAGLVLTIATVNLCALMFARLDARRHEISVRLALGAGRWRVLRGVALEGLIIGVASAAGGVLFASYSSTALTDVLLRDYMVATALDVSPSSVVVAMAMAASVIISTVIALLAAALAGRASTVTVTPGAPRAVTASSRAGRVMVAAQTALSIVLLVHAALLARNVYNIMAADDGLTDETVLAGMPIARPEGYKNVDALAYYQQAFDRLLSIPGVQAAAFSEYRPDSGGLPIREPVSDASDPAGRSIAAETTLISPGFFDTLGIPLRQGRDFSLADRDDTPRVAIISRQLAQQLFGEESAIGRRIHISIRPQWQNLEIVGVANDARVFDLRGGNRAIAYVPLLQSGDLAHYKVALVRGPVSAAPAIREAVEGLDIETLPRLQTLEYARARALLQERVMAGIGGYFSVLTLALVSAGLYGLLSFVLSMRRKEFAIRMALGARGGHIGRTVARDGLLVVGIGAVIGLAGAVASSRVLANVLAAVSPYDSVAIALACGTLISVSVVATAIPALRAARVEPLEELRRD